MSKKKSSFNSLSGFIMLLVIFMVFQGGWQLHIAWDNPRLVGWIPSGTLLLIGSMVCAYLVWRRHGTQRSTLLPLMFVMNSASLVKDILQWQAKKEDAVWLMTSCILVALILALIIAEEIYHRKQTANSATREPIPLDMEDKVMSAQALALARLEVGNADKFTLTSMVLMLLAGVFGLLSLAFQMEPQHFWLQFFISIVFLAIGFIHWRARRTLNRMRASLRNLESP